MSVRNFLLFGLLSATRNIINLSSPFSKTHSFSTQKQKTKGKSKKKTFVLGLAKAQRGKEKSMNFLFRRLFVSTGHFLNVHFVLLFYLNNTRKTKPKNKVKTKH